MLTINRTKNAPSSLATCGPSVGYNLSSPQNHEANTSTEALERLQLSDLVDGDNRICHVHALHVYLRP